MAKHTNSQHRSSLTLASVRPWGSWALASCVAPCVAPCVALSAVGLVAISCGGESSTPIVGVAGTGGTTTDINQVGVGSAGNTGTAQAGSGGSTAAAGAGGSNTNTGGSAGNVSEGTGGMALDNGDGGSNSGNTSGGDNDAGAVPQGRVIPAPNCEPAENPQVPNLQLAPFITNGLSGPLYLLPEPLDPDASEGPATERLYVVEQGGNLRLIVDGELQQTPFLQIGGRIETQENEQGLLGLAFHPDFQSNGLFYVNYSRNGNGDTIVSEFSVAINDGGPADTADPDSERILLTIDQPQANHNGGNLVFGPDGFLYIGMGDGGSGNDPHGPIGNGQNVDALLGKILRINVTAGNGQQYTIPADNPFVNANGADEIWSLGIRNPWRFTFDACTGDMYIGDVGQNALEEIDFEPAGVSGRNYGWRCAEGDQTTGNACAGVDQSVFIEPVATRGRNVAQSITGGYVYRGSSIPDLRGTYLYADFQSAEFFALRMDNGQVANGTDVTITDNLNPGTPVRFIASFGEDNNGELYVVSLGGAIFRVQAAN